MQGKHSMVTKLSDHCSVQLVALYALDSDSELQMR